MTLSLTHLCVKFNRVQNILLRQAHESFDFRIMVFRKRW